MRSLENFEKLVASNAQFTGNTNTASSFNNNSIPESELEFKSKVFAKGLTDTIHSVANEPSLGFYRIEEHVHKSIQGIINKKCEIDVMNEKLQGAHFDLDYSTDTITRMYRAKPIFDSISDMITDSLFAVRQINIRSNFNSSTISPNTTLTKQAAQATPTSNSSTPPSQLAATNKKDSIFSGILAASTSKFRTSSISISENLNNQETRKPQRSQTMLISSINTTNTPTPTTPTTPLAENLIREEE